MEEKRPPRRQAEMIILACSLRFRFSDGTEVRRLGYGAMRSTGQPGNFGPYEAWDDGKKLLQRALELGINFIDTARA